MPHTSKKHNESELQNASPSTKKNINCEVSNGESVDTVIKNESELKTEESDSVVDQADKPADTTGRLYGLKQTLTSVAGRFRNFIIEKSTNVARRINSAADYLSPARYRNQEKKYKDQEKEIENLGRQLSEMSDRIKEQHDALSNAGEEYSKYEQFYLEMSSRQDEEIMARDREIEDLKRQLSDVSYIIKRQNDVLENTLDRAEEVERCNKELLTSAEDREKEIEQRHKQLLDHTQDQEKEIERLKRDLATMSSGISSFTAVKNNAIDRREWAERYNKELLVRTERQKKEIEDLKDQLSELSNYIKAQDATLDQMTETSIEYEQYKSETSAHVKELNKEIEDLKDQLLSISDNSKIQDEALEMSRTMAAGLKSELLRLSRLIEIQDIDLNQGSATIDRYKQLCSELSNSSKEKELKIEELENKLLSARTYAKTQEEVVGLVRETVGKLENQLSESYDLIRKKDASLDVMEATSSELQKQLSEMSDYVKTQDDVLNQMTATSSEYLQYESEMSSRLKEKDINIDEAKEIISEYLQYESEMSSRLKEKDAIIAHMTETISKYKEKAHTISAEYEQYKSKMSDCIEELEGTLNQRAATIIKHEQHVLNLIEVIGKYDQRSSDMIDLLKERDATMDKMETTYNEDKSSMMEIIDQHKSRASAMYEALSDYSRDMRAIATANNQCKSDLAALVSERDKYNLEISTLISERKQYKSEMSARLKELNSLLNQRAVTIREYEQRDSDMSSRIKERDAALDQAEETISKYRQRDSNIATLISEYEKCKSDMLSYAKTQDAILNQRAAQISEYEQCDRENRSQIQSLEYELYVKTNELSLLRSQLLEAASKESENRLGSDSQETPDLSKYLEEAKEKVTGAVSSLEKEEIEGVTIGTDSTVASLLEVNLRTATNNLHVAAERIESLEKETELLQQQNLTLTNAVMDTEETRKKMMNKANATVLSLENDLHVANYNLRIESEKIEYLENLRISIDKTEQGADIAEAGQETFEYDLLLSDPRIAAKKVQYLEKKIAHLQDNLRLATTIRVAEAGKETLEDTLSLSKENKWPTSDEINEIDNHEIDALRQVYWCEKRKEHIEKSIQERSRLICEQVILSSFAKVDFEIDDAETLEYFSSIDKIIEDIEKTLQGVDRIGFDSSAILRGALTYARSLKDIPQIILDTKNNVPSRNIETPDSSMSEEIEDDSPSIIVEDPMIEAQLLDESHSIINDTLMEDIEKLDPSMLKELEAESPSIITEDPMIEAQLLDESPSIIVEEPMIEERLFVELPSMIVERQINWLSVIEKETEEKEIYFQDYFQKSDDCDGFEQDTKVLLSFPISEDSELKDGRGPAKRLLSIINEETEEVKDSSFQEQLKINRVKFEEGIETLYIPTLERGQSELPSTITDIEEIKNLTSEAIAAESETNEGPEKGICRYNEELGEWLPIITEEAERGGDFHALDSRYEIIVTQFCQYNKDLGRWFPAIIKESEEEICCHELYDCDESEQNIKSPVEEITGPTLTKIEKSQSRF